MVDFIIKHKLINPSRSAWVPKQICYGFFEEITKWVDDGSPVDVRE